MENKKYREKEVSMVKRQASGAMKFAESLKIKSQKTLEGAITLLGKIKQAKKIVKEHEEEYTRPAKDIIKKARETYGPLIKQCDEAERIVKDKMKFYDNAQEAKAKEKEEKIAKEVEEGKMSFEKGAEKIEKITPKKTVETKEAKIQYRITRKPVITDESKIPREYLVPDMVKIRKVALAGVKIPGIKVVEEKTVASYSK